MRTLRFLTWLVAPALAAAVVACQDDRELATAPSENVSTVPTHASHTLIDEKSLTSAQRAYLGKLRNTVTAMSDEAAMRAKGWDVMIPCRFKAGVGSQGVHYINLDMVGNGTIDPLQPSILMYETQKNGKKSLIGVEWGVPLTAGTPPDINGLPFHANTRDGLWVLHIWVPQNNPSGIFADWNPTVSCSNDQPADEIL